MSYRILTKNGVDNTNIDGARNYNFNAGMRSGIVKGAFNEGKFFASAPNIIALDSCELRISGHQIVIDSTETITLNDRPSTPTKYSMIAEIQVSDSSVPSFRLFIQPANVSLRQDNLFKTKNGSGTYQLRIGNFTLGTTGLISDVIRTADIITGGGEGGVADIKFNATATQLSSSSQPTANIDYNEETGEYDAHFGIPAGGGTDVTIGGVIQQSWSADFAESERQKSKNLFPYETVSGNSSVVKSFNSLPAGTYTLSAIVSSASPDTQCLVEVYYNDTYIGGVILTKSTIRTSATITINSSFNKLLFYGGTANYNNYDFTFSQVQLEQGSVATDYQPCNGAIVHKEDLNKITTLWENPSPSSEFVQQTITLANDNYDYAIMICAGKTNELNTQISYMFTKGTAPILNMVLTNSDGTYNSEVICRRVYHTNNTQLNIQNCIYSLNSQTAINENNLLIPVKVIGIKINQGV